MTSSVQEPLSVQVDPRQAGVLIEAKLREWGIPYEYVADFPVGNIRSADWAQVRMAGNVFDSDTVGEFRTAPKEEPPDGQ
jgi:hypothetical protein